MKKPEEVTDKDIVEFLTSLDGELQVIENGEEKTYVCSLLPIEDCEACQ